MNTQLTKDFQLDLFLNKKGVLKNIGILIIFLFLLRILIWCAGPWNGGDYYYPVAVIIALICIPIFLLLLLYNILLLFKRKPIITIYDKGFQIHNMTYQPLGLIMWKDISHLKEYAFEDGFDKNGRQLWLAAQDLKSLIGKIPEQSKRDKVWKACNKNKGWLFCITVNRLDCDQDKLKILISDLIEKNKLPVFRLHKDNFLSFA